ncbi:VOC family protein [Candidatus Berkelbacteria bacterium]|nr:VOC family protein [Candidatus Berkelbacteria bacterium]
MIAHVTLHVSDYEKSKVFYKKVLAPFGYVCDMEFGKDAAGFKDREGNHDFWLAADGTKQPTHVAFWAKSQAEVKAFYKAALAVGGRDNGKPGYRTDYGAGYYAAFVHDPDGHNIEGFWWDESK